MTVNIIKQDIFIDSCKNDKNTSYITRFKIIYIRLEKL